VVQLLIDGGGWDPALGARPMRSAIQRLVEGPLAEKILAGELSAGDEVRVDAVDGELAFSRA
jgi:ATP-dependent Clp protease ATP-binding subunit ClpC